jgi:hypothetical protein
VFVGTGTAGAYHAGVLRALLEAGVRIDVVAGRGIGAATALFAAVDAGPRLWEHGGAWRSLRGATQLYGWRTGWRLLGGSVLVAVLLLLLPIAVLALLAAGYPLLLLVTLLAPAAGAAALASWRELASSVSGPQMLTGVVPRLVTASLLVGVLSALGVAVVDRWRHGAWRHPRGAWWWRALGAPFDAAAAVDWAIDGLWQFLRGAAPIAQPSAEDFSRRYAELLADSLGQPGYRELILVVHDLDSRRDLVFALLAGPWRIRLAARLAEGEARDLVDLAGAGRGHVVDALAAALRPPLSCDPHTVAFAPESYWRGERHRVCDRPSGVARLLREVAEAGATQVIVVSATPPVPGPHALIRPPHAPRDRFGEVLDSVETAALEDALNAVDARVRAAFVIRAAHNPVGPFAFGGAADARSDRRVALGELVDRGYEDAYRQFLEPVIGASGEQMHGATVVTPTQFPDDLPLK